MNESKFWARVAKGGPNDCWPWRGYLTETGYGRVRTVHLGRQAQYRTHRLAYFFHYGVEPGDLLVRHKCDNPPCCNPAHLELGTQLDNALDREARNPNYRRALGSQHAFAKLTEEQVADMKGRYRLNRPGDRGKAAREFGVSTTTVERILSGVAWKHVQPVDVGMGKGAGR